jgi:hypothetical protein
VLPGREVFVQRAFLLPLLVLCRLLGLYHRTAKKIVTSLKSHKPDVGLRGI